ncbi:hypothetical protein NB11A_09230 [Ligilactobacillus agilis]|nr:hypothetical protein NB11A_09230 [Ligilactobacillus agilis]
MFVIMINILCCFLTVIAHELIHYLVAYFLGCKPKLELTSFWAPSIKYENNHRYLKIFLVAVSAPIMLTVVGVLLPLTAIFFTGKILCLANIFNLLPITTDGEVALYALLKLKRR